MYIHKFHLPKGRFRKSVAKLQHFFHTSKGNGKEFSIQKVPAYLKIIKIQALCSLCTVLFVKIFCKIWLFL